MKILIRALLSLLVMLATLFLANCSPYGCRVTFGSSTCTSSGSTGLGGGGTGGGGGGGGGGTGVDASAAAALVYYDASTVNAAGYTTANVFGTLNSYTAPTLPNIGADDMLIVNKKFLYIPMGDLTVSGFVIDRTTGTLTPIPGSPFTVPGSAGTADDVATDPQGRFLFVGTEGSAGLIWSFQINQSTGALVSVPGSPFTQTGMTASDIVTVDASGTFLYAGQVIPALGVAGFRIDSTGALTALAGSPFTAVQVAQIHSSPTAELLFGVQEVQDATTSATDKHIYAYAINANTGALTEVGTGTVTLAAPFDFAISPNGSYLYAMEATGPLQDAPIEGFAINPTTATLASFGTFSGVPTAEGCRFDQSGLYLFCINTIYGSTLTVNVASPTTGALTHGADLSVSTNFPYAVTD